MLTVEEFKAACKRFVVWRDRRTRCPHCRARLLGRANVVIPSRHCPECGGRVLADPPAPDDPDDLPTEAEYKAAAERYLNVFGGICTVGLLAWFLGMCLTSVLSQWLARNGPGPLISVIGLWSCFGPPVVGVILANLWYRRAKRNPDLVCPSCREVLTPFPAIVGATGRCHACGRQVLADPEADADLPPPAGPPYGIAEFRNRVEARRRFNRQTGLACWAAIALVVTAVVVPILAVGPADVEAGVARWFGLEVDAVAVGVWTAIALVVVALVVIAQVTWPARQRHRLTCPDCEKEFANLGLVLASRRCDHCHGLAVADPDPGGAATAGVVGPTGGG